MLIGVISGTYSTVFIAAPMLLWLMGTQTATKEATKPTAIKEPVTTAGGRN
jgi:preprotein translocase subunit SecF